MSNRKKAQAGFTFLEIVSVMAVSGVLATLGLPMVSQLQAQSAASGAQQVFAEALAQARSHAVAQGKTVKICGSRDGLVCSENAWSEGWLIHQGESSTSAAIAEQDVIAAYQFEEADYELQVFDEKWQSVNEIRFDTQGFNLAEQRLAATLCQPGLANKVDAVLVERTGRVRVGSAGIDQQHTAAALNSAAHNTSSQCNQA